MLNVKSELDRLFPAANIFPHEPQDLTDSHSSPGHQFLDQDEPVSDFRRSDQNPQVKRASTCMICIYVLSI